MRMGALGVKGQILDGSAQHAGEIMRAKHKGRFTGSMAIVLVGLALMAGGREAGAQTLTELVSNLQTRGGIGHLVCVSCTRAGLSQAYAQALTTGPGGATLHSIDMRVRLRTNEPQTPTLEIRRGAPNGPLVATLAGPHGECAETNARAQLRRAGGDRTRSDDHVLRGGEECGNRHLLNGLFVHTESEETTGLASAEAQTRRLRLVLEGSREVNFGSASLTPSVEVGMRYDGGDAETGAGVELGGGVRFAASGLTMEVRGRGLLAHEERDYEEWGVSASAVFSPGSEGRGLSMRVGSAWGAASSRADRVWTGGAAGLAGEADLPGASLDAEVAYGLDALRGLLTSYTGVALSENGETWRAGARWTLGPALTLSLEAILIEPASGS